MFREKETTEVHAGLAAFHLFFDENKTLQVGGRLQRFTESLDVKHPILLSKDYNFLKLIVMDAHCKVMHGRAASTMCLRTREVLNHTVVGN